MRSRSYMIRLASCVCVCVLLGIVLTTSSGDLQLHVQCSAGGRQKGQRGAKIMPSVGDARNVAWIRACDAGTASLGDARHKQPCAHFAFAAAPGVRPASTPALSPVPCGLALTKASTPSLLLLAAAACFQGPWSVWSRGHAVCSFMHGYEVCSLMLLKRVVCRIGCSFLRDWIAKYRAEPKPMSLRLVDVHGSSKSLRPIFGHPESLTDAMPTDAMAKADMLPSSQLTFTLIQQQRASEP
jgi:hypothetical protein